MKKENLVKSLLDGLKVTNKEPLIIKSVDIQSNVKSFSFGYDYTEEFLDTFYKSTLDELNSQNYWFIYDIRLSYSSIDVYYYSGTVKFKPFETNSSISDYKIKLTKNMTCYIMSYGAKNILDSMGMQLKDIKEKLSPLLNNMAKQTHVNFVEQNPKILQKI
jgi:hypothetical protein